MNKVFVDSNIFFYFLTKSYPSISARDNIFNLFIDTKKEKIKLITNNKVIDELFHKLTIYFAISLLGKEYKNKKIIAKLQRNKEILQKITDSLKVVFNFLKEFNIEIINITFEDMKKIPEIMLEYNLMVNDSIILTSMIKRNLKFIATFDKDFNNIDFIKIYFEKKNGQ